MIICKDCKNMIYNLNKEDVFIKSRYFIFKTYYILCPFCLCRNIISKEQYSDLDKII